MIYTWNGGRCAHCGVLSNLFAIVHAVPPRRWDPGLREHVLVPSGTWYYSERRHCVDRARCQARREKQLARQRTRGTLLVIAEPKFPDAPRGSCCWCGEQLQPKSGTRRYCYPEREGRDCRSESWSSRAWTARQALIYRGDPCCVDCGSDRPDWEADHEIALEDGGEHTMENLRRRCVPCHQAKTAAENLARARQRRPRVDNGQLRFGDAA